MTAGRGIEHAEISPDSFLESGGPLEIIQVWMNLPAALKRCEPWYRGFDSAELLHVSGPDASWTWHVIAGEVDGQRGPVASQRACSCRGSTWRPARPFRRRCRKTGA